MVRIEVKEVTKRFGATEALKKVTLTLAPGKIYGLLGRNGAGKTTLLNIITNKLFADAGEVSIDGEPARENDRAQAKIFHMSDTNLYPPEMKVREAVRWTREFYPDFSMDYAKALMERFSLDPGKKIKALSTGYQSIVKLVLALASGAPAILFDEPVLGLDANHRELFYKELLAEYGAHPRTIVVSTHLIDEVAGLLEEAIVIKAGEIILAQPVEEILRLAYTVSGKAEEVDKFAAGRRVIREETMGPYKAVTIYQQRDGSERGELEALGLEIGRAGLQELFVSLTDAEGGYGYA